MNNTKRTVMIALCVILVAGIATSLLYINRSAVVPDLVGRRTVRSVSLLADVGFTVETKEEYSDTVGIDRVISQSEKAGEKLKIGSTVTITVSLGREPKIVPDVLGMDSDAAEEKLKAAGFKTRSKTAYSDTTEVGKVANQSVMGGLRADPDEEITIYISNGPENVVVPGLVGKTFDEASLLLDENWLELSCEEIYHDTVPEGYVIFQSPKEGQVVDRDTVVKLQISLGKRVVDVPNVYRMTLEKATEVLEARGFTVSVTEAYSDTIPEGYVITQTPDPQLNAYYGSEVVLTVSLGTNKIDVPNVMYLTREEAVKKLEAAGFVVKVEEGRSDYQNVGTVFDQDIMNSAEPGATVTITVCTGPTVPQVPDILGLSMYNAAYMLQMYGYKIQYSRVESDDVPVNHVVSYSPTGQVPKGTTINVVLSLGPAEDTEEPDETDDPTYSVDPSNSNIAANVTEYGAVTEYKGWILFADVSSGGNVYKMRPDGSEKQLLSTHKAWSVSVYKDWVYYAEDNRCYSSIYKVRTDGTGLTKIAHIRCDWLYVSDGWIYYTTIGGSMLRMDLNGNNTTSLADAGAYEPIMVDGWIYYLGSSNHGALYKVKASGGRPQAVGKITGSQLSYWDGRLYLLSRDTLISVKPDGSDRREICSIMEEQGKSTLAECLVVSDGWMYYYLTVSESGTSGFTYKIMRVRTDGSDHEVLLDLGRRGVLTPYLNVQGRWLYYPDGYRGGQMNRIKLDGSGEIEEVG